MWTFSFSYSATLVWIIVSFARYIGNQIWKWILQIVRSAWDQWTCKLLAFIVIYTYLYSFKTTAEVIFTFPWICVSFTTTGHIYLYLSHQVIYPRMYLSHLHIIIAGENQFLCYFKKLNAKSFGSIAYVFKPNIQVTFSLRSNRVTWKFDPINPMVHFLLLRNITDVVLTVKNKTWSVASTLSIQ